MSKPNDPLSPPDPSAPYIPRLVDPAPYDPDTPPPAPVAAPRPDPVALARQLAAEAKAKAAAAAPKEDPVALAKRLGAEAKAKAAAAAAAAAPKEDPVALAKRLAAQAKAKAAAAKPAPAKPAAPAASSGGLDIMSRVGKPRAKKRSAAEILAEARINEAAEAATPVAPSASLAKAASTASASPTRAKGKTGPSPAKAVLDVFKNATLREVKPVTSGPAFKAVWSAHLARAQATEDAALAICAASIIAAVERVGSPGISAVEIRWGGQAHAVFVESTSGDLIATAYPAGVYLAGV